MSRPRPPSAPRHLNDRDGGQSTPPPRRDERRAGPRAGRGNPGGGRHWLWGVHPVLAALGNGLRRCHRLVVTAEALKAHGSELEMLLRARPLPPAEVISRPDLDTMLPFGVVHQGMAVAVDALPDTEIADLLAAAQGRDKAVIMVLDQVTDPHNVGAVLRSAAAFGALGLVVPDRHAPDETGTLAKSASGALERLPLVRVTNLVRSLEELKAGGFWIAGLAGDAPNTLAAAKLDGRIALVLGSEGEGLRRLTREHCDHLVKLPQTELVESLNVSNAAAVALYELVRR